MLVCYSILCVVCGSLVLRSSELSGGSLIVAVRRLERRGIPRRLDWSRRFRSWIGRVGRGLSGDRRRQLYESSQEREAINKERGSVGASSALYAS